MSIVKRTVFVEESGGCLRPFDLNMVITTLGVMVEPNMGIFIRGVETSGTTRSFDATDEVNRVDEIKFHSLDKEQTLLGDHVHGGTMIPRNGR